MIINLKLHPLFYLMALKHSFRNTIKVPNDLNPDQDDLPNLGPNSLQRLSAGKVHK